MLKIWAIARTTFKEAIRNRILYILLVFALLLLASSGVISDLSIASHDRIIKDLGVFGISAFGLLIAVFVGIGLIYNEMDKKTIYTIISKPIHRHHYILGKFWGLLMTIYLIMLFMTFFFMAVIYYFQYMSDEVASKALFTLVDGQFQGPTFGAYLLYVVKSMAKAAMKSGATLLLLYHSPITAKILPVVFYSALELGIITAFAILYSTFTSPTLSAMFTVLTFVIGRMNEDLIRYAWYLEDRGGDAAHSLKHHFALVAGHIAPNLEVFNKRADLIYQNTISIEFYPIAYALAYAAAILVLAMIIFRRRNLK